MRAPDTSLGGDPRGFPQTPAFLKSPDPNAPAWARMLDVLSRTYWKPVYHYFRTMGRLTNDDAKDLAQQFFLHLLQNQTVERYQPTRAPFRVYLKTCLRNFLVDHQRRPAANAVPLEGQEEPAAAAEAEYDREWLKSVMEAALAEVREELHREGRADAWKIFENYDLRPGEAPKTTYGELAAARGATETDVRGALALVRGRLRERAIEQVRKSVSDASELYSELGQLGFL